MPAFPRRTAFAVALLSPLFLAFPFPAESADAASVPVAPPPPVDAAEVETIVITADPFARTVDQLVQPTEILSGEELDRRRGATLGETLEHELGVSTTDFGRGAGRPVIRGQAGPRVLMLENGISSMDASDVSADHDVSIDPAHAEQIEILKGPATLLYGSSASAGVVNVVDGRLPSEVDDGFHSNLRGSYGTNGDERAVSGRAAYGFDGVQLGVDGSWLDADDYDIHGNSATDGSGNRNTLLNSAVEKKSGSLSAAKVWDHGSLAASVSRFETQYGLPVEETAFIDMEQDRIDIEGRWLKPFSGLDSIRVRAARGDYEHTEFEAPGEPGTVFHNDQTEGRIEAVHAPFAGLSGVLGVQRRDREFEAIGEEAFVPSTETRSLGIFLIERAKTPFGSVEFGARSDHDTNRPDDRAIGRREFNPLSFSGGALFDLDEHYHLKFYATRSERSPVTEELYSFGPHLATGSFERGDDRFDLERAHNYEVSLDRHGDALSWRINVYMQRIGRYKYQQEVDAGLDADGSGTADSDGQADRVDEEGNFDPDGDLLLLDYVAADARFWGTEGEIGYAWTAVGTEWRARVFGDLARGRVDGGGDLPRITPARFGAGLHGHRGPWSASVDFTRVQKQDRIASLETETDGYSLLAMDADYTIPTPGGALMLFLRGRNLLDEEARRHTSFIKDFAPLPGASVVAGVEWRME
jgi:iron complex outermembrane receptor protein